MATPPVSRRRFLGNLSAAALAGLTLTPRLSRALDRLLDPDYEAVTLSTLKKAATAVGREVRLELV